MWPNPAALVFENLKMLYLSIHVPNQILEDSNTNRKKGGKNTKKQLAISAMHESTVLSVHLFL